MLEISLERSEVINMTDNMEKDQVIRHCEQIVCSIKDIVSAKITTAPGGKISEIHVLSNSTRDPKQIVRDIESAIIASLGSKIDYKKISIAQLNDESEITPEIRLKLEGMAVQRFGHQFEARVILSDSKGHEYEGKASGDDTYQNRLRIIAYATLCAIDRFLQVDLFFSLEDVLVYKILDKKAVSTLIYLEFAGAREHLLGTALVKHSKFDAVIAAVLNAFNRRITFMVKTGQA